MGETRVVSMGIFKHLEVGKILRKDKGKNTVTTQKVKDTGKDEVYLKLQKKSNQMRYSQEGQEIEFR